MESEKVLFFEKIRKIPLLTDGTIGGIIITMKSSGIR